MEEIKPINFIVMKAQNEWKESHSRKLSRRFFRMLGALNPAEIIYICEYAEGDFEKAKCRGKPISIWQYDGSTFEQIEQVGDLDRSSAIASKTPVISYCINETTDRMIYTVWHGGRAAYGIILVSDKGEWVRDGFIRWKA